MKRFAKFFLAWYFPILGSMYFIYLLTGSPHITDPLNLAVPALAVIMLYAYHKFTAKKN